VVAKRRADGLAVDPETVRRAIANSRRPDYPLPGLFFTPEEQAEDERADRQLSDRAKAVLSRAGAEVGGVRWCWIAGRRGVQITVKAEVERYRELLERAFGSDRVLVGSARYSEREQNEICASIESAVSDLVTVGIKPLMWGPGDDGVDLSYFAADRESAERVLVDRFGSAVTAMWIGPSSMAEELQTFGSWISEANQLTVFYPLAHNGERPGRCTAEECPDRVVVSLTIEAPQGFRTDIGGYTPSHATVELNAAVGRRAVIDAAQDLPRPEWTGRCS
jgi:hypothetical protein